MSEDFTRNKIEAYLLGQLSGEERVAFESELNNDPKLKAIFDQEAEVHKVMELLVEEKTRSKLKAWQSELNPTVEATPTVSATSATIRTMYPALLRIAAVVLLGMLAIWVYNDQFIATNNEVAEATPPASIEESSQPEVAVPETEPETKPTEPETTNTTTPTNQNANANKKTNTPKKATTKKSTPKSKPATPNYAAIAADLSDPIQLNQVRSTEGDTSPFNKAVDQLLTDDYKTGIAFLESIDASDPKYYDAQYAAGLSLYHHKNAEKAIPFFENVVQNKFYLYLEKAEWYLILSHLKAEHIKTVKTLLHPILEQNEWPADERHSYYEKAVQLNQSLK